MVGIVTLAVAMSALFWSGHAGRRHQSVTLPPLRYHFAPGEQLVYHVSYSSKSDMDLRPELRDRSQGQRQSSPYGLRLAHNFVTSVAGDLTLTVLEERPESYLISYQLAQPRIQLGIDGKQMDLQARSIDRDLQQPIRAEVDRQGKITSVRFGLIANPLSRHFGTGLLGVLQFVLPEEGDARHPYWVTQEEDPNGSYTARYESYSLPAARRSPILSGGCQAFRKRSLHYMRAITPPDTESETASKSIQPSGALIGIFDVPAGRLVALDGTQIQDITIAAKPAAHSVAEVHLQLCAQRTLFADELKNRQAEPVNPATEVAATPLSAPPPAAETRRAARAVLQQQLGDTSLASLLHALAAAERSAGGHGYDTGLYLKTRALASLQPETCKKLGELLAHAAPGSHTMLLVAAALDACGSPQAQAALAQAIRARSRDWPALTTLIPALGATKAPTELAEKTLQTLASKEDSRAIASTAQLSLGIMAYHLARSAPQRANGIVDEYAGRLAHAESANRKSQYLLVLGNTGSGRAFAAVSTCLQDPSPQVRAAAAFALRWIPTPQAEMQVVNALCSDSDARVRAAAVSALQLRPPNSEAGDALMRAARSDPAEMVRAQALSALWRTQAGAPSVRALVAQIGKTDPAKSVRQTASEIMANYAAGSFDR